MIVQNTTSGPKHIGACFVRRLLPADVRKLSPEDRADYEKRLSTAHGEINLFPGPNEVDAAEWMKATSPLTVTPVIKHWISSGVLVVASLTDLSGVKSIKDAVALVKSCGDTSLLDKWAEGEKRGPVKAAIKAQKAEIVKLLQQAAEDSASDEPEVTLK